MSASIHVSSRHARSDREPHIPRLLRLATLTLRFSLIFASLLAALAGGLYTQIYDGPWSGFVAREFCGAFYALAWCMGLALLRPTARPRRVGLLALTICVSIEISQLWHPHVLEVARATLPGRLALGSGFAWADLPWYAVGAAIGAAWLAILPFRRRRHEPMEATTDHVRPMGVQP